MFAMDGSDTAAIATGILDPEAGARAEAWLQWKPRGEGVEFLEAAIDKEFARKLAVGLRQKTSQV